MKLITEYSQPFDISAINNTISFQYAGHSAVTSQLIDPLANWRNPKTFRLYFWTNLNGGNYDKIVDFQALRFTTSKVNQTVSFSSIPQKYYGDPAFALSAVSSSNLPVTYSVVSGPATISGNIITLIGTGTVVVQASQPGNTVYNAATSIIKSFTVSSQSTTRVDH